MKGNQYRTIVADPPWAYDNRRTGGNHKSGSAQKYPVMTVKDISQLPVASICERDAVLFLWATTPLLPDALSVMQSWGFKYKTAVYWDKMKFGMGYWFRGQVELCIIGTHGNPKPFRCQLPNIIRAKRRGHSQKPDEFFERVEPFALSPRIELFARAPRPGWDVWGNEVGSDIALLGSSENAQEAATARTR